MTNRPIAVRTLLAGALLLVTAACGTNLDTHGSRTGAADAALGGGDASVTAAGPAPNAVGASLGPFAAQPGNALTPGTGDTSVGSTSSGQGAAAQVRAVKTLSIGIAVPGSSCTGSCAAGDNSLGIKGIGTGATGGLGTKAQYQILLDDVNAHGGLLGRKLVPVWYIPDTQNGAAGEQAACSTLTQDNHVFAAIIGMTHTPLILACLQKAGVVVVQQPGYMTSDAMAFTINNHYFSAGGLNLTRLATAYVDGLYDQNFFDKTAKIGLVAWDTPEHNRAANVLKQALARHGLKLTEDFRTTPTYGVSDASSAASQNQSAVLRFRASGVNRVLFLGIGGSPGFFFITAAEAQSYYPRYGLTSNDLPESLRQQAQNSFKGAAGVGWWPVGDTTAAPPLTPAAKRCKAMTERTGDSPAYSACDALDIFLRAARGGGNVLSANSVMAGLELITNLTPSVMSRLQYGPGRHDGVSVARHFAFVDACSCLRYTSGPYAL